jgi:SnoaL-like domain
MKITSPVAVLMLMLVAATPAVAKDANLTYLADRLMIQDLMVGYATAHNATEPELYRKLFTDDAEIALPNGTVLLKGIDKIMASVRTDRLRFNAAAKDGVRTYGVMRHIITNMEVTIAGNTATGSCYLLNTAYNAIARKPEILSMGRYEDVYLKKSGQWRISKRVLISDWGNDELAKVIGVGPYTPPEYR